jgi:hypothetical protein
MRLLVGTLLFCLACGNVCDVYLVFAVVVVVKRW